MIRIHNKNTGWIGRERTDSDLITLQDGEVKLEVIKQAPPKHEPETQRLIKLPPKVDKRKKTYTEGWKVEDLTHYEIAMREWQFPEYEIRITAPIQLVLDDFGVKMKGWFELKGLPVVATETTVQLWCAEVQPQFQETVEGLVKQGVIQVDKRPEK